MGKTSAFVNESIQLSALQIYHRIADSETYNHNIFNNLRRQFKIQPIFSDLKENKYITLTISKKLKTSRPAIKDRRPKKQTTYREHNLIFNEESAIWCQNILAPWVLTKLLEQDILKKLTDTDYSNLFSINNFDELYDEMQMGYINYVNCDANCFFISSKYIRQDWMIDIGFPKSQSRKTNQYSWQIRMPRSKAIAENVMSRGLTAHESYGRLMKDKNKWLNFIEECRCDDIDHIYDSDYPF